MHNSPTLESAVNDFGTWRTNRNKHTRLPAHLITTVKQLGDAYPIEQIAKALGLKEARVNKMLEASTNLSFLEVPKKLWIEPTISCMLHRADGTKLAIQVGAQQLNAVMEAFLCCK